MVWYYGISKSALCCQGIYSTAYHHLSSTILNKKRSLQNSCLYVMKSFWAVSCIKTDLEWFRNCHCLHHWGFMWWVALLWYSNTQLVPCFSAWPEEEQQGQTHWAMMVTLCISIQPTAATFSAEIMEMVTLSETLANHSVLTRLPETNPLHSWLTIKA
jgi:hypothetical protein